MGKFPWGEVVDHHEIGPYGIIEYKKGSTGEILFHGTIDGKDTNRSWDNLEEALVGLIVKRNIGCNHDIIARHFIAGIKVMGGKP